MSKTNMLSLGFNAKIKPFEKLNEQFLLCKCYIHGLGKNRNLSHFSKENALRNLHTIFNVPVVGHLIEADDGTKYIGSHDTEISLTEKGVTFKDLTVPFGVVPQQGEDTLHFEDVVEPDGNTTTYLVGNIILWCGRYPELLDAIYSEDIYFNQSMEINYEYAQPLNEDRNYIDLIDYTYSALCLLGKSDSQEKHSEPCFPCSRVEPYKFSLEKTEFSEMMSELKNELAFCFENNKSKKEGGKEKLNQETINAILAEFKISLEDLNFEVNETMSEKDLRDQLDNFTKSTSIPSRAETYAATYQQKREALNNVCDPITVRDDDGNVISNTYFWVQDFDDEFVFVERNIWSDNDDECSVGRFSYVFDEATLTATLTSEFEKMVMVRLTIEENEKLEKSRNAFELMEKEFGDLKKDFEDYKIEYSTANQEVEELKTFKTNTIKAQRTEAEESLFAQFDEKLGDDETYQALKSNCGDLDLNALEEKCFSILGKKQANFTVKPNKHQSVKISLDNFHSDEDEPYGGICNKHK